ncbi:MAG: hypothetical protein IJV15_10640 [Lachnospiraceae bacterium]|nr:hypothetical protein [Lachnospiraceae bacterium]
MMESIKQMYNWIRAYYPDMIYVSVIIVAALYLFICKKEHRKSIIWPLIVILICILNPVIYKLMLRRMVYWRMFWMIPDAILIAYAVTDIIKRCKSVWSKIILAAGFTVAIAVMGVNVYNRDVFDLTRNPQKVSANTKEVCAAILSVDSHPKCIIPDGMYTEARQYNGDIELMYGRNADGYINELNDRYKNVHYQMQSDTPDYEYVFSIAKEDGYNFVVCNKNKPVPDNILQMYGYVSCLDAGEYWVYYDE